MDFVEQPFGIERTGNKAVADYTEVIRLTTPETAKLIRKDLKAAFPGQKFSVRSSSYAGGSSVSVSYVDGPYTAAVDAVVGKYAAASFNGMIDLKEYKDHTLVANEDGTFSLISYGPDYVLVSRDFSPEAESEKIAELEDITGEEYDPQGEYDVAYEDGRRVMLDGDEEPTPGELYACGGLETYRKYGSNILYQSLYATDFYSG